MKKPSSQKFFDFVIPENMNELQRMIAFANYLGISYLLIAVNNLITNLTVNSISKILKNIESHAHKYSIQVKFAYLFVQEKKNMLDKIFDRLQIIKMLDISANNWKEHLKREIFHVFHVSFENISKLDKGVYEIGHAKRKFFIITLKNIIFNDKATRAKLLISAKKVLDVLNKSNFLVLFGTGASKMEEMRNPRDIKSFLKLLGIRDDIASISVSKRAEILFTLHKPFIITKLNQ